MSDAMALKTQLLNNFSKFLASPKLVHADDILCDVFNLSAHCRYLHKDPKTLFTPEERRQFHESLTTALPHQFNKSLIEHLFLLGGESAARFRKTRSGLQFLKDDFIAGDKELEEKFDQLMDGGGMTNIELKLENWTDDPGEYYTGTIGLDTIDLRG
ncbi:unnamed protein product, partial [Strongylus vulgaris]